jgi:5-methylcytosine-specific restriction endonuclease McrA
MGQHDHLYNNKRWVHLRLRRLRREPLCATCLRHARVTAANVVDHIVKHNGDLGLFWDEANHQSLCYSCHNSTKQSIERRGYDSTIGHDGWPIDPTHPVQRRGGG